MQQSCIQLKSPTSHLNQTHNTVICCWHLEHLLPDRNHLCFREMSHWMEVVSRNSLPLTVDPCLTVRNWLPNSCFTTQETPSLNPSYCAQIWDRLDLGTQWDEENSSYKAVATGECMNMSHVFKVVDLDILDIWWYLHFFHWCRIICAAHLQKITYVTVYASSHLVAVANVGSYKFPVLLDIWRCDVLASRCSLATLAACTASGTLHFQDSVKSSVAKPKKTSLLLTLAGRAHCICTETTFITLTWSISLYQIHLYPFFICQRYIYIFPSRPIGSEWVNHLDISKWQKLKTMWSTPRLPTCRTMVWRLGKTSGRSHSKKPPQTTKTQGFYMFLWKFCGSWSSCCLVPFMFCWWKKSG